LTFTKITCAGAGTMGSQVAWQMAFHGKRVTVYDAIPAGLEKGKAFHREYADLFTEHRGATEQQIADTFERLTYSTDLSAAVSDADLISDSVPESMDIKESFWADASRHAPPRTVFTTNTSTLTPSQLVHFADRPKKFLALHFAIGVWDSNIGEVMGHLGTDREVFENVLTFAHEIGHLQGASHQDEEGVLPYSHARCQDGNGTVMSSPCEHRFPQWSRPPHWGSAETQHNARVLNETASMISSFLP